MSTGMFIRHLRKEHRDQYSEVMEVEMKKKKRIDSEATKQPKISNFVTQFPSFEKAFINWMVQTYQPLSACENVAFKTMCHSLTVKAPILGREKIRCLLTQDVMELRTDISVALKGLDFSSTTDSWTANNNVNYSTCTIHFIDRKTWVLHWFALGIFKKTGTLYDTVRIFGRQWILTTTFALLLSQIWRQQCAKQGVFSWLPPVQMVGLPNGMAASITS
jgi:hypothetical protein